MTDFRLRPMTADDLGAVNAIYGGAPPILPAGDARGGVDGGAGGCGMDQTRKNGSITSPNAPRARWR